MGKAIDLKEMENASLRSDVAFRDDRIKRLLEEGNKIIDERNALRANVEAAARRHAESEMAEEAQ